jgi:hypothetical protein
MRQQLKPEIDVVGVGSIESGTEPFLFLLCGAAAVQVGTCHWKEGTQYFDQICNEPNRILNEKGYTSAQDCIGKLKPWSKELTRAAKQRPQSHTASSSGTNQEHRNLILHRAVALIKRTALVIMEGTNGWSMWYWLL